MQKTYVNTCKAIFQICQKVVYLKTQPRQQVKRQHFLVIWLCPGANATARVAEPLGVVTADCAASCNRSSGYCSRASRHGKIKTCRKRSSVASCSLFSSWRPALSQSWDVGLWQVLPRGGAAAAAARRHLLLLQRARRRQRLLPRRLLPRGAGGARAVRRPAYNTAIT